jgi:Mannosyltransferase (PIG-V)
VLHLGPMSHPNSEPTSRPTSQRSGEVAIAGSPPNPRLREGVVFALVVFAASRVLMSIVGVAFVTAHPQNGSAIGPGAPPATFSPPATPGLHNAIDGMQRYDAAWFEWIAADGYGTVDARGAFFPGYPLLIRATSFVTPLGVPGSAVLVANLAFALALIVLFALSRLELGSVDAARRSVVLFACLPTAFFLLAPLSEAPFLLASLLAWFWARTGRWGGRVALAAFAACMIRSIGVALVAGLVIEALRPRRDDGPGRMQRLAAAGAGLLAPALYATWWWTRGRPLEPLQAQSYWHRAFTLPFVTLVNGLRAASHEVTSEGAAFLLVDGVVVILALAAAVFVWRRFAPGYTAYVWISLLIPLCSEVPNRPLLSLPRFAAVLFPFAWVAGAVRSREWFVLLAAVCLVWQVALAMEFMNWGWIF